MAALGAGIRGRHYSSSGWPASYNISHPKCYSQRTKSILTIFNRRSPRRSWRYNTVAFLDSRKKKFERHTRYNFGIQSRRRTDVLWLDLL